MRALRNIVLIGLTSATIVAAAMAILVTAVR